MVPGLGCLALLLLQGSRPSVVTLPAPPQRPARQFVVQGPPDLLINEAVAGAAGEFAQVKGVVRLSTGTIAVANSATSEIRFFSPDGRFLKAAGRKGSGPGEFQQLFALFLAPGDTIIGYDVVQGFHVFTPGGRHARTLTYGRQTATPLRAWPYGWFEDGTQLAGLIPQVGVPPSRRWLDSLELLRVDPRGENPRPLFRIPGFERAIGIWERPTVVVFGPQPAVAVWSRQYCAGYSGEFAFRCGELGGREWYLRRRPGQRRSVPAEAIERYKNGVVAMPMEGGGPPPERLIQQREEAMRLTTFAEVQPLFGLVLPAEGGDLWVQRYQLESEMPPFGDLSRIFSQGSVWDVFGMSGAWKATVTLPARFRPYQVGRDSILGVLLDADDVEQVAQYRLSPRR